MAPETTSAHSRRITLVADELLGYVRTGGLGTTTAFLALALARMGHEIEVLYFGPQPGKPVDPRWTSLYETAGVNIRPIPRGRDAVEPSYFGRMRDVELALRADPPDVAIVQDLGAPAYCALRLRQLGLSPAKTLYVVLCHGTRRWITDMSRKVRVLPGAHGVTSLEQASLELADVVVSPNSYLVDWMRRQLWNLPPRTVVIPFFTRSGATGEPPPKPVHAGGNGRVERFVFFGRLEERKGVRPFAAGLNALAPELLHGLELEFLGRSTPAWTPDRVRALLSAGTAQAFSGITFETELDQPEALARLSRPGTLAVIPSLEDNSPNAVYECLERGIPFLASRVGGIPELVAPEDRDRILFEPTAEGVAAALRGALSAGDPLRPARPAFAAGTSFEGWAEILALRPRGRAAVDTRPAVDVVLVHRQSVEMLERCLDALARQSYRSFSVIVVLAGPEVPTPDGLERVRVLRSERTSVEAARQTGLGAGRSPWIVFLDEQDVPEPELLETLVRAQGASGADAVTCGLYVEEGTGGRDVHLFAGEPQGLGLLSNGYGTVALLRRSLLGELETPWPVEGDHDWPLLARLSASGAHIVSVPAPLLTRSARPGALREHPSAALLVVDQLERALPAAATSMARLAAGLAVGPTAAAPRPAPGLIRALGGGH